MAHDPKRQAHFLRIAIQKRVHPAPRPGQHVVLDIHVADAVAALGVGQLRQQAFKRFFAQKPAADPLLALPALEKVLGTITAVADAAFGRHGQVVFGHRHEGGKDLLVRKGQPVQVAAGLQHARRVGHDAAVALVPDIGDGKIFCPTGYGRHQFGQRRLALGPTDEIDAVVGQHPFGDRRGVDAAEDHRHIKPLLDPPGHGQTPAVVVQHAGKGHQVRPVIDDGRDHPVPVGKQPGQPVDGKILLVVEKGPVEGHGGLHPALPQIGGQIAHRDVFGPHDGENDFHDGSRVPAAAAGRCNT